MDGRKETLRYARRLFRDESGVFWLIPLLVTFALSTAGGVIKGRAMKKAGKHGYERALGLHYQQKINAKELDIEKMREMTRLNESRLKLAEASSFQKGSYTGPYFQVVRR